MMQGGHLPLSSRADWSCTARNPPPEGKDHEGFAPSYSAAGESHLHPGKTSLPSFIKIVWCWCYASAAFQLRKLSVHSTKFPAGAVQPAQWRELDLSSSRATAEFSSGDALCPSALERFSSLSGWNRRRGKKNMRAARPHTPRQVRITCTTANKVAVFL